MVIDEIQSYKDSPADEIYDRFEEALFAGHPLAPPILGTPASVKKITSAELRRFVQEHFTPERMAFTVVADIDESRLEEGVIRLATKYFPVRSSCAAADQTAIVIPENHFNKTLDKRNHEANAVIGGLAPSLYEEKDRITAVLLANILGGPASNSLLNSILRERNGWVYGVECGYTQYRDTGIMAISLGCDRDNLEKCFRAISKTISSIQDKPLGERSLKAAKKQLLGQLAISSESGEAQCLSMGKSLLAFSRVASEGENRAAVEAICAEDLQLMAQRIFNGHNLSKLVFL